MLNTIISENIRDQFWSWTTYFKAQLSIILILLVLLLIVGPPSSSYMSVDIIKKRAGEIEKSLQFTNIAHLKTRWTIPEEDGFLVRANDKYVCRNLLKPSKLPVTTLLITSYANGYNKEVFCSIEKMLKEADLSGYSAVLIEVDKNGHDWKHFQQRGSTRLNALSKVAFISHEDATTILGKYIYPESVRFHIRTKLHNTEDLQWWLIFPLLNFGQFSAFPLLMLFLEFVVVAELSVILFETLQHIIMNTVFAQDKEVIYNVKEEVTQEKEVTKHVRQNMVEVNLQKEACIKVAGKMYIRDNCIGKGAFGQVYLVRSKTPNSCNSKVYAMKEVDFQTSSATTSANNADNNGEAIRAQARKLLLERLGSRGYETRQGIGENDAIINHLLPRVEEAIANYRRHLHKEFHEKSFTNEVKLLEKLKSSSCSKYVAQLVSSEIYDSLGIGRIIMEYGELGFFEYTQKYGTTYRDIRPLWNQMVDAVDCIHSQGIVHFDIKLANFIWVGEHIKLIDFGTAQTFEDIEKNKERVNPTGFGGTPGFRSPEVIANDIMAVSFKADIWSLGSILYYLFYHETPLPLVEEAIGRNDDEVMPGRLNSFQEINFPPFPEFSLVGYCKVMGAALKISPHERPNSVLELKV